MVSRRWDSRTNGTFHTSLKGLGHPTLWMVLGGRGRVGGGGWSLV